MINFKTTKDGSHTLFNEELQETYHSLNGAIEESKYVFIEKGFNEAVNNKANLNILEVGYGTGLNCLLTFLESKNRNIDVDYTGIEKHPLSGVFLNKLNYNKLLSLPENYLEQINTLDWNINNQLSPTFSLTKLHTSLEEFESDIKFDLVYFDAFAPSKQADIWSYENFKKLKEMMNQGSILVTYASTRKLKKILKDLEFKVEVLPGFASKREMIRSTLK